MHGYPCAEGRRVDPGQIATGGVGVQTAVDLSQGRKSCGYGVSCCGGRVAGGFDCDQRSKQYSGSGDSPWGRLLPCGAARIGGRVRRARAARVQGGRPRLDASGSGVPALASKPVGRYAEYIKNDSHLRYCQ